MKLSKQTYETLRNFADISRWENSSFVLLKPGHTQAVMSHEFEIMAIAECEEDFPVEFAIYDVGQLLSIINTMDDPDLTFDEDVVTITDGDLVLKYRGCVKELGIEPPKVKVDDPTISFSLDKHTIKKLLTISSGLDLGYFVLSSRDNKQVLEVRDIESAIANSAKFPVGEEESEDFVMVFETQHFKIIPDDYKFEVVIGTLIRLTNEDTARTYLITCQDTDDDD